MPTLSYLQGIAYRKRTRAQINDMQWYALILSDVVDTYCPNYYINIFCRGHTITLTYSPNWHFFWDWSKG